MPTGAPLATADPLTAGLLEEPEAGVEELPLAEVVELEELQAARAAVAQRAAAA